jgi:broad specificity phosphatase PhoE
VSSSAEASLAAAPGTVADATPDTVVHLLRHGEVHNPEGVLYGRMPGYHLSELGRRMAERVAASIGHRDITHLVASPLERAQETAAPLAEVRGLEIVTDARVIESENWFEGKRFSKGENALRDPRSWLKLYNPLKPSWGEPYAQIVERMMAAVHAARIAAHGHEAVIVSHQLPIWTTRLAVEGRSFLHDPRKRQCTLASLTSLHFIGADLAQISYSEPAIDLVPRKDRKAAFSAGAGPVSGGAEDRRP